MNQLFTRPQPRAIQEPIDVLLADVAVRIQLSVTDHDKAVDRYQAVNQWLDRDGCVLQGLVILLYPQGSMAIGATIASKMRTDEYDIDIVAQLDLPPDTPPQVVLDLLYQSIRGEPGSRYYTMTKRQTRCVTITYADGMHLDITPAILAVGQQPKTSFIFHHKPEDRAEPARRLLANPWGFAQWYTETTPLDHSFAEAYGDLTFADSMRKAAADPVPDREAVYEKSKATVALQLLKRWRNVQYDSRINCRRPPSVMFAKLVADGANQTQTLGDELLHQAQYMRQVIRAAHMVGQKVRIVNPRCPTDVLTDRWPESLDAQGLFLHDLDVLVAKLTYLQGDLGLEEMQPIMVDLFGENPTGEVFKALNERMGRQIRSGLSFQVPASGRFDVRPAAAASTIAAVASARAKATPAHTFYGSLPDDHA